MTSRNNIKTFAAIAVLLMLAVCLIPSAEAVDTTSEITSGLYGTGVNAKNQATSEYSHKPIKITDAAITKVVTESDGILSTTFYITSDGKLYGMGSNNHGQQGDGTTTDVPAYKRIGSELGVITDVVCSAYTTFFLTADGKLYGMGYNSCGQQGDGTTTDVLAYKQIGSAYGPISKVACSTDTTHFITSSGKLYGMGSSSSGQLYIHPVNANTKVPNPVQIGSNLNTTIIDVVCSDWTTYFITSAGKLYGLGDNSYGQMAKNTSYKFSFGDLIYSDSNIAVTDVTCSRYTTFFITSDGELHGIGRNNKGQMDCGTEDLTHNINHVIGSDLGTITDVACSLETTFFITSAGKLYGMGLNDHGQIGNGTTTNVNSPIQISSDTDIVTSVVCSNTTTFFITSTGKLYGMGQNNHGQMGNGAAADVTSPIQIGGNQGIFTIVAGSMNNTFFYMAHLTLNNGKIASDITKAKFTLGSAELDYAHSDNEPASVFIAPSAKDITFKGYYTQSVGGLKVVGADGNLEQNVPGYTDSEGKWIYKKGGVTLFAQYEYTITLDNNYVGSENGSFGASIESAELNYFVLPVREEYDFAGYFADSAGTRMVIDKTGHYVYCPGYTSNGNLVTWQKDAPTTLYARWINFSATVSNKYYDSKIPDVIITDDGTDLDPDYYQIDYYGSIEDMNSGTDALDLSVVKNPGTYHIKVSGKWIYADYVRVLECTISKKPLDITAGNGSIIREYVTSDTGAYLEQFSIDPSDNAVLKIDGLAGSERPVISDITANYNSSEVAYADTVTVTSITLVDSPTNPTGFDIDNYSMNLGDNGTLVIERTAVRDVRITASPVAVISAGSPITKTYDGTTDGSFTHDNYSMVDLRTDQAIDSAYIDLDVISVRYNVPNTQASKVILTNIVLAGDGATNYEINTYAELPASITKAVPALTTAPVASADIPCDGEAKALIAQKGYSTGTQTEQGELPNTANNTVLYSISDTGNLNESAVRALSFYAFGKAELSRIDIGTYYIYYMIKGDENHDDRYFTEPLTMTIKKRIPIIVSAPVTAKIHYDGSAHGMVSKEGVSPNGSFLYHVNDTESYVDEFHLMDDPELERTDVGTYYVFYKVTGEDDEYEYDIVFGPIIASIDPPIPDDPAPDSQKPSKVQINPVVRITKSDDSPISEKQTEYAVSRISKVAASGQNPSVQISSVSSTAIPKAIVESILDFGCSLTYSENGVTIVFSPKVLKDLESKGEIILSVDKRGAEDAETEYVRNGTVYDIRMTVNDRMFNDLFSDRVPVYIDYGAPDRSMMDSIRLMFISDDGSVELLDHTYSNRTIAFEVAHFSRYAVDYDLGSTVCVKLDGGMLESPGNGWTYRGGYYEKEFAIGTSLDEILADLGPVSKDLSISTGMHSTSAVLTDDDMTIEFSWFSLLNIVLIALLVVFSIVIVAILLRNH